MLTALSLSIFIVSLFITGDAAGIWRFSPYGDTRTGKIATERKVTLTYAEAETISWQVDNQYCTVEDDSQAETVLTCQRAGVHRISLNIPSAGETTSRFITFWRDSGHFAWSAARHSGSSRTQLWIFDLNETPATPSQISTRSRWVTEQFAFTGQVPEIEVYEHGLYKSDTEVTCQDYDATEGYWLCTIGVVDSSGLINLHVHGGNVPLMAHTIRETMLALNMQDLVMPTPSFQVTITTATIVNPYIVRSPNLDGLAVWIDSTGILVTSDSFATTWSPVISASAARTEQLVDVAFTWTKLVILTNSYLYFIHTTNHTVEREMINTDISADTLVGIRGYDWASKKLILLGQEHVVVWTSTALYSIQGNGSVTQMSLSDRYPNIFTSPTVSILDAAFTAFEMIVGVLVKLTESSTNKVYLFTNDLELDTWSVTDLSPTLTDMHTLPWRLSFCLQAHKSALIWSNYNIIGCRGNDTLDCALLQEHISGDTTHHTDLGEINHAVFSQSSDVIFMTTKNALFYTKTSLDITVQVNSGESTSTKMAPYFNSLNHLYLITRNGPAITSRMYSLDKEIFSAMISSSACQVLHLATNMDTSTYYIDMRGRLELWVALLRRSSDNTNLQLITEGTGKWNMNMSSSYLTRKDMVQENMTVTVYHQEDYTGATDYSTSLDATKGHIHVEIGVTEALTCPPRRPAVACITIGCHPSRKIRVIDGNNNDCARIENFTIKRLENGKLIDQILPYQWENWGCPIKVKSGRNFVPSLGLYENGKMVEKVPVDFIMWEHYDQPSIEYNTTMEQVGCVRTAQTWQSMGRLSGSGTPPNNLWGPHNYESCFSEMPSDISGDLSRLPYQIFNSTNYVAIEFSAEYDGIYVFTAKIVDPNYSFCSLAVEFAVEVYGTIPLQNVSLLVNTVMSFIAVFMALLILSYIRLRTLLIREEDREEALMQNPDIKLDSYISEPKDLKDFVKKSNKGLQVVENTQG